CFALIAYLAGNVIFANYLQIHYVAGTGELAVFCGALVGASLGFLWFNAPPAMVFMGDTGSLSCGGALGAISLITKHELVLAIIRVLLVSVSGCVIGPVQFFEVSGCCDLGLAALLHLGYLMGCEGPTSVLPSLIFATPLDEASLETL